MKVLSLFDGMACGALALQATGIEIERYDAYEIDEYAIKTAKHNFPFIKHHGDVFKADFTEFKDVDLVCGGSPCTYWSIAQKNNRETEASGMGWELFQQYVRAVKEAKPKFFVYENNKSMSKAIRASIDEAFGFEAIHINSALVSAQNRNRLYWVGKRNEDGTYSKVEIEQPEDRGILLRDVLDGIGAKELSEREIDYMVRNSTGKYSDRWSYLQKPGQSEKGLCITANISKGVPYNICAEPVRIPPYGSEDKARPINALYPKNCGGFEHRMFSDNPNKQQVDMIAEPVCADGEKAKTLTASYFKYAPSDSFKKSNPRMGIAEPVRVGSLPRPNGELSTSQAFRIYDTNGKSININAGGGGAGGKTGLYAIPVEFDGDIPTKAVSSADGKPYTVYEVKDGQITIKGKEYPIKLTDGFYIIRKLTVRECMRLQTVPEWYEFPVSNSQAYKMLGNGWTVDVIAHLFTYLKGGENDVY